MEDVIQVNDQWYIAADSQHADTRTQVLKQGDTFAVFDRSGEIGKTGVGELGLYHRGTRHLSQWELLVNGRRPMLLNSAMKQDNSLLVVEATTPDIHEQGDVVLPKGQLHVFRALITRDSTLYEHLRLTNYYRDPLELLIEYRFAADFRDIFEVRGVQRSRRGAAASPAVAEREVVLAYTGLDDVERRTGVVFDGQLVSLDEKRAVQRVALAPGEETTLHATIACTSGKSYFCVSSHARAVEISEASLLEEQSTRTVVETSNEQFNDWINRSVADLRMLSTETVYGRYPYAGVPWFSTPFGRDGLITALQTLWTQPLLARGVLAFLAATQADAFSDADESAPGKILHELREGEMAALGEVPFRRYYGTVDATPLFLVLAGRYYRRTGDLDLIESIRDNLRRAVQWIDESGDSNGDGFVDYQRHNSRGLVQQGWKDSDDSVFHADGRPAPGPIALCEVQGYVYEARLCAAELEELLGDSRRAADLRKQAAALKRKFHEAFWIDELGTYALALDGEQRPCAVRSSNAGHLLYSGIVDSKRAETLARTLTNPQAFNGWGVRTISEGEARYNPMSYHNGSVWPHDTGIIAAGLSRYGFRNEALMLLTGLFNASIFLELARLPELFCGFDRLRGHGPTLYPVACSPQAWAAGTVFMLLEACLGLSFSAHKPQVRFDHPILPDYLNWVRIRNLQLPAGTVDITLRRHPRDVGLNVDHKEGDIDIVVIA